MEIAPTDIANAKKVGLERHVMTYWPLKSIKRKKGTFSMFNNFASVL